MVTTVTPANVAAIAGQGKRNGKGTNPDARTSPVVHVAAPARLDEGAHAPIAPANVTVDMFRSAIDAADATRGYVEGASATLAAYTLARYAAHAARFVHTVDGKPVVLANDRAAVAAKVWQDAGYAKAPAAKDRTSALKSLGQYVAKFGTVATDLAYGVEHLVSTTDADSAYDEISADSTERKREEADRAFTVWLSGLLPADAKAITRTIALMSAESADAHRAAFTRAFTPAK